MDAQAVDRLAASLLAGTLPDAQAWDVATAVRRLADGVAAADVQPIRNALKALNGARQYDHARMLADEWTAVRGFDATVGKHLAQALVNSSALDAAQAVLEAGLPDAGGETLEYEGLLGRVAKQRFVATGDLDELKKATDRYLAQYQGPKRPYWHGVNAVALRAREEREGLGRAGAPTADALAAEVLEAATAAYGNRVDGPWPAATASEAALARNACDQAELRLYRFLHHPAITPFGVESYARQIREIWRGDAIGGGGSCADRLAAILSRHVAETQSRLSLSPSELDKLRAGAADTSGYEKNFSGEGTFSLDALERLVDVCASIAVVCTTRGERLGTGFLVAGSAFGRPPAPVFVTNAHVLSDTVANAIRPKDARVSFEVESAAAGTPVFHAVEAVLFSSPPGDLGRATDQQLDVTIVQLAASAGALPPLALSAALPLVEAKARAYVVGHPRGGGLQIALHDSRLIDVDDDERLLHYRTPTDPGSSGSPVFNEAWEVIGLHHAGSAATPRLRGKGTYEANEAIALGAVARRAKP